MSELVIAEKGVASVNTLAIAPELDWAELLKGARPSSLALARLDPEGLAVVTRRFNAWDQLVELTKGISQNRAIEITAPLAGLSVSRWGSMVLEYKRLGWRAFADKRSIPAAWTGAAPKVGADVVDQFSRLVLTGQRPLTGRTAHLKLREHFGGRLPRGCSYANLMRRGPSPLERAAAKQGAVAARKHRAPARMTRSEGWVMGLISFDDVWQDQWTLYPRFSALPAIARPVGGFAGDYFSSKLFAHFLKPRFRRPDGTCENLTEWDFLCFVEYIGRTIGFARRGTTLVVENAVATVREDRRQALTLASDGLVKVEVGGIQRRRATMAHWGAKGGGNPRTKGWLESLWNLLHNRCSLLPGQMGLSPDKGPEDIVHLLRYTEGLIEAAVREQGGRTEGQIMQALRMPLLWWSEYGQRHLEIVSEINDRKEHEIEGWDNQVIVDPATGFKRKLSPSEVFAAGAADLWRIDDAQSAIILGTRFAGKPRRVVNGEISVPLRSLSGDDVLFDAGIVGLQNGLSFKVVVNELAPDRAFVFTLDDEFIVAAPRIVRADAFTKEARMREIGRANAREAAGLSNVRRLTEPAAQARRELQDHNEGVLAAARQARGLPPSRKRRAKSPPAPVTAEARATAQMTLQTLGAVGGPSASTPPESATGGAGTPPVSPPKRFRLGAF